MNFFFNIALQVEDISPVIFLQYFSVILSPLSPPFFSPPGDCSMWQSELCVITQQETISLPHICCQGSAKNGAVLGLSDLTTSHRAPELPTPGLGEVKHYQLERGVNKKRNPRTTATTATATPSLTLSREQRRRHTSSAPNGGRHPPAS